MPLLLKFWWKLFLYRNPVAFNQVRINIKRDPSKISGKPRQINMQRRKFLRPSERLRIFRDRTEDLSPSGTPLSSGRPAFLKIFPFFFSTKKSLSSGKLFKGRSSNPRTRKRDSVRGRIPRFIEFDQANRVDSLGNVRSASFDLRSNITLHYTLDGFSMTSSVITLPYIINKMSYYTRYNFFFRPRVNEFVEEEKKKISDITYFSSVTCEDSIYPQSKVLKVAGKDSHEGNRDLGSKGIISYELIFKPGISLHVTLVSS